MKATSRRSVLRLISNGLFVLTSRGGDSFGAGTISWVSQVSFKPQLVMLALRGGSSVHTCLSQSGIGVLHVLGMGHEEIARKFFKAASESGGTLNGEPWRPSAHGAPVLVNLESWIECHVLQQFEAGGDHDLFVVEVLDSSAGDAMSPLTVAESPWEYGG